MPTHRTLAEITAEIESSRLPALFLDTCCTLDVVRCAARGRPRIAGITKQLLDANAAGEVTLIAPSVLEKEAARNRVEVETYARRAARAVDDGMAHHRRVADTLATTYPHTTAFSHESLIGRLVTLHDQLLSACVYVSSDHAASMAALARAGDNRRPARKGGGVNDCILLEEFLGIARAAPAADPLVLLTTNTSDFGDTKSPDGLHADVGTELGGTRASVSLSWEGAAAKVLRPDRLRRI